MVATDLMEAGAVATFTTSQQCMCVCEHVLGRSTAMGQCVCLYICVCFHVVLCCNVYLFTPVCVAVCVHSCM